MFGLCQAMCWTALTLHGCNSREKSTHDQLALSRVEAMNRHDTNALASFYADSARVESPNWEGFK